MGINRLSVKREFEHIEDRFHGSNELLGIVRKLDKSSLSKSDRIFFIVGWRG
jgi:hypothetical protein